MGKTDHCCFCFDVKTGVHILGVLLVLGCVAEIWHETINPLRWAVKIGAAGVFIHMYMRDSPFARQLFFYTFIANMFALAFVNALTDDSDSSHGGQMDHLNFDKIAE